MRGLNLSALAARGRAAEGAYSAQEQIRQARVLRSQLTAQELAAATKETKEVTVDRLSSISAHTAYLNLAKKSTPIPRETVYRPLPSRPQNVAVRPAEDPNVFRALGPGRLALYNELSSSATAARPFPGSSKYAEGAMVGMMSFSIATAIVGSVGLAGILGLYFNPGVIDDFRSASRRLRDKIDESLGDRLRRFATSMRTNRSIMSEDSIRRARQFARDAVKAPVSQVATDQESESQSS